MRNLKNLTDAELHAYYCSSNDVSAISEIYNRYHHIVFGICLKFTGSKEDSKDIMLEVFADSIEKWKFTEIRNTPAWLHVIAKNKCLNFLKTQKRFNDYIQLQQKEKIALEEEYDLIEERLVEMNHYIDMLPKMQKACIDCFFLKKMSYKEIAQHLNITLGEVRSNIQNGRRNLRIQMTKTA